MKPPRKPAAPAAARAPGAPRIDLFDPRAPYLVPLLLLLAARLFLATRIEFASEDALITFRYAWMWVHGHGPVFNPDERVLGFTSPPWMAWIALGMRLGASPLVWARAWLVFADAMTLVSLAALLERHASRAAAWCWVVFFAGWPYFGALACSGLEPGVMLMLVALTALLIDRQHAAAGVALGLLAVIRPEGLLAAAVLGVWAGRRDRLVALGILAATLAALALYYGSPVPQSVIAKHSVYGARGPAASSQWWFWATPVPVQRTAGLPADAANLALFALVMFPAALSGIALAWSRRGTALAGAFAALCAVWASLIAVGASYFFWYLAAPAAAWGLLASSGMPRIARGRLLYAGLAIALATHWFFEPKLYSGRANTEGLAFGSVAEYVGARAHAGESLMLEPIGTIGWRNTSLRIVDEVGLVSPEATEARQAGAGWYSRLLERRAPDWLVVRASLITRGAAFAGAAAPFRDADDQARALGRYEIVAASDSSAGDLALMVLHRKGAEPAR